MNEVSALKIKSVLVVEDNVYIKASLVEFLEHEGYKVDQAENGSVALALLVAGLRPGIILLNLQMPVMGGAELIAKVNDFIELQKIPVTICSSDGIESSKYERFIKKPYDLNVLLKEVQKFCGTVLH